MADIYSTFLKKALFKLDAEAAHELGMGSLVRGLGSSAARRIAERRFAHRGRPVTRFGLEFPNPMGLAAGFDKNGVAVEQLASLGFGFVEAGTVTAAPQPGNPKPRLFRLPADHALINRLGFNNNGADALADRIAAIDRRCVIGINIGKNKDVPNEEAVENYLSAFNSVHAAADYIAVNISSPNTPGLRQLQSSENLEQLLSALRSRNVELGEKPLLVKIAPDLTDHEIEAIADICRRFSISGVIATNTTIERSGLRTSAAAVKQIGAGGLSGEPLRKASTEVIRKLFRAGGGKLPIIGVGGVFSGADAFEKIAAGASLVQAYTGFIYRGPGFARDVNNELADELNKRGLNSIDEARGSNA